MAYQALYRKWRPKGFDDVRGQDHIVTTLKNQIAMNRIGHAYLFNGTRGTGKTSVAKIFAKAVNCEQPKNGSPCGCCAMCRAVDEQRSMNVIEIDAASNNGVDNIREIRNEVTYSPSEGRYRVYIIDEVHMLSPGAFNALLKTLEEPPSYVIFILATTEVHKIPITVLSRCQRYDFRRIQTATITERLRELVDAEGMDVEDEALSYVARVADGSLRDALSLLDQCYVFYIGKKLKYENVLEVLGAVDTAVFGQMLRCIVNQDTETLMLLVDEMVKQGRELTQFVGDFIWYLRNLLMLKSTGVTTDLVEASREQMEIMLQEASLADANMLMRYIRIFSELSGQIRYSTQKRVLVEVALIKLCQPVMERNMEAVLNRMSLLENKLAQIGTMGFSARVGSTPAGNEVSVTEQVPTKALSEDVKRVIAEWKKIRGDLTVSTGLMLEGALVSEGPDNELIIGFNKELRFGYFENQETRKALARALEERTGKSFNLSFVQLETEMESAGFINPSSVLQGLDAVYED